MAATARKEHLKIIKWVKWTSLGLVALVAAGSIWLYLLQEAIPASDSVAANNSQIFDEFYAGPIGQASENLEGYRKSLVAPSISVAVAVHGELVWAEARGYADIASKVAATPDTVYAVGSVSKPITAVLAARLWETGQLDIDADVREYVEGFPAKHKSINTRQLLSHQAGIRHYKFSPIPPIFSESSLNREFSSTEDSLALFVDDPLLFEPDTNFNYSTFGYTLVAAAIEDAAGRSFVDALQQHVLDPLKLNSTSIDRAEDILAARATDYVATFSKKAVIRAPETNSSYKWAGGGMVSTPSDLVRFASALLDDQFLNDATREVMFTARALPDGELNPQHYGLGWRIGGLMVTNEKTGKDEIITLLHHGGTRPGSTAILMIVPDYEIVVAMTSNTVGRGGSGPLTSVAAKVAREFIGYERAQSSVVTP